MSTVPPPGDTLVVAFSWLSLEMTSALSLIQPRRFPPKKEDRGGAIDLEEYIGRSMIKVARDDAAVSVLTEKVEMRTFRC
jgi:hypothetical protein